MFSLQNWYVSWFKSYLEFKSRLPLSQFYGSHCICYKLPNGSKTPQVHTCSNPESRILLSSRFWTIMIWISWCREIFRQFQPISAQQILSSSIYWAKQVFSSTGTTCYIFMKGFWLPLVAYVAYIIHNSQFK